MAFQPAPGVIRIAVLMQLYTTLRVTNTLHLFDQDSPAAPRIQEAAALLVGVWGAQIMPELSDDTAFTGLEAYDLTASNAPKAVEVIAPPIVGGETDQADVPQSAVRVRFIGSGRGRTNQGGIWVPGVGDAFVDDGLVIAGKVASLQQAFSQLGATAAGAGFQFVILSRTLDGAERPEGVPIPITTIRVESNVRGLTKRTLPRT